MTTFIELSDFLKEKHVKENNKHWKCMYHVGKEIHYITIFTNKKGALEHCDNLGLTLCL